MIGGRKMNQQERDKMLVELNSNYQVMNNTQQQMLKDQQELKENQKELNHTQRTMQEELTRLGNIVARMEHEHGRKLDMILEVLTGHDEKLQEHEKRFEKDEKIIELHGHQIYGIEQKMQA